MSTLPERALKAATPTTLFVILFVLACLTSIKGQDHAEYMAWSSAAVSGDIHRLAGPEAAKSPTGVPFKHWSAGPGLLIAPFEAILAPLGIRHAAGLAAGFVCVCVFWSCLFAGLREMSDDRLAILGCALAFVATPLGYYSLTISSETYSLFPAGILFRNSVALGMGRRASLLAIGASTGILLMIRSYLAAYAWPALVLALFGQWRLGSRRAARCLTIFTVPVGLAILQIALVNYWMTGDFLRPGYQFGDEQFQSLDWRSPHAWRVLFDPFHGLLPTHPFMGLGFLLMARLVTGSLYRRNYAEAALWMLAATAVGINVYAQGSWYCWWLARGSFGMRGMVLAAIPATAAFVRALSLSLQSVRSGSRDTAGMALLAVAGGCVVWSWLLLTQRSLDYFEWRQILHTQAVQITQWLTMGRIALLLFCGLLAMLMLRNIFGRNGQGGLVNWTAWLAAALSLACLADRLYFFEPRPPVLQIYAAFAAGAAAVMLLGSLKTRVPFESLSSWMAAGMLCAMLAFFLPLAIRTHAKVDRPGSSPEMFDETHPIVAYLDLLGIPRLEPQRNEIGDFLRRQKGEVWYERLRRIEPGAVLEELTMP